MTSLVPDPIGEVKLVVIGAIAVVALGLIVYLGYTKSLLETKVADQALEISQYKLANETCKSNVAQANSDLKKAITSGTVRQSAVASSIKSTEKTTTPMLARAAALMVALPNGDDCAAAKSLTNSYFGGK